jgi:hypothetical protein
VVTVVHRRLRGVALAPHARRILVLGRGQDGRLLPGLKLAQEGDHALGGDRGEGPLGHSEGAKGAEEGGGAAGGQHLDGEREGGEEAGAVEELRVVLVDDDGAAERRGRAGKAGGERSRSTVFLMERKRHDEGAAATVAWTHSKEREGVKRGRVC